MDLSNTQRKRPTRAAGLLWDPAQWMVHIRPLDRQVDEVYT
jgi:hypothetical protein